MDQLIKMVDISLAGAQKIMETGCIQPMGHSLLTLSCLKMVLTASFLVYMFMWLRLILAFPGL